MYKAMRKIHLWCAVPLGWLMVVICVTGMVLLFQPSGERTEFFLGVMKLHRWLFDAPAEKGMMTPGKMVVAITTCCMVLSLLSGIALWWIRARKNLKRNLQIPINKGWRTFFTHLHVAGGMYAALLLLVIALTGLTWSFGWWRTWIYELFSIAKGSHIMYEVHTGSFWGVVTQVLWFVAALIGAMLPITGYYMWLSRKK